MEDSSVADQIATLTGWLAEHYADEAMDVEIGEQLQALAIAGSRCGCAMCQACWDWGMQLVAWLHVRKMWGLERQFNECPNAELQEAWTTLWNHELNRAIDEVGEPARRLTPQQIEAFWRGWQVSHEGMT